MNYAIEILKQEAIKLSGQIVAEELLKKDVIKAGEPAKMAYELLFGSIEVHSETDKKLVEIIKVIKILRKEQS